MESANAFLEPPIRIVTKMINNIPETDRFKPTFLVNAAVPQIITWRKNLSDRTRRLSAVRIEKDKLSKTIASKRIKVALYRNVFCAVSAKVCIGKEVFMLREKSVLKEDGLYIFVYSDGKLVNMDKKER